MTPLESYLRNEFQTDKQQLSRTIEVIELVFPMFSEDVMVDTQEQEFHTWPYRRDGNTSLQAEKLSHSTHCMIAFALNAILQATKRSTSQTEAAPLLFQTGVNRLKLSVADDSSESTKQLSAVLTKAVGDMFTLLNGRSDSDLTASYTYGSNDPLTLTWLSELLKSPPVGVETDKTQDAIKALKQKTVTAATLVCQRPKDKLFDLKEPKRPQSHSFLWGRARLLAKAAGRLSESGGELETGYIGVTDFEDELHRHLGYLTILDSRFDPAALVFALEGALQYDVYALTDSTVDAVFRALEQSQERNPYWRPVLPLVTNPQGTVLFPVSVEITNSLLRSFEILRNARRPDHRSQLEALLRRYVQWLLARAERTPYTYVDKDKKEHHGYRLGWHSEHVNERGMIHMWETSQVLLFLVHYATLLQRKIADDGLVYAGLRPREWNSIDKVANYWENSEPLQALSEVGGYAVLRKIQKQFLASPPASTSLLLYGPPGTGKTTVAEQMAVTLERSLLTITVSDFLAGGASEVEARAKGIFQVLEEQEDLIILFDEIDQFLLDRNSRRYARQTDIFQFLTPGMLTKLQDLKDRGRCIFIMATNYYERIDSAIKRQGRFDERLLLSLPDTERRKWLLWEFLAKRLKGKTFKNLTADANGKKAFAGELDLGALLRETVLFGYGDLKALVKLITISADDTWTSIVKQLGDKRIDVQPSVKLGAYRSRVKGPKEERATEEFAVLLYLLGEAGRRIDDDLRDIVEDGYEKSDSRSIAQCLSAPPNAKDMANKAIETALAPPP